MGEPSFAFEFGFELPRAPTGVSGEEANLLGGGEGLAEVDEFFEGMAKAEVGHDVGVGQEKVGVEVAEGAGLDGAAEEEGEFFDGVGEVGDEHFADFVGAGLVQNEAECALSVVLADQND